MTTTPDGMSAMDIGSAPISGDDLQATNMQVNYDDGRAAVMVQGTDVQPTDTEGWQAAGKRLQQRATAMAVGFPSCNPQS